MVIQKRLLDSYRNFLHIGTKTLFFTLTSFQRTVGGDTQECLCSC